MRGWKFPLARWAIWNFCASGVLSLLLIRPGLGGPTSNPASGPRLLAGTPATRVGLSAEEAFRLRRSGVFLTAEGEVIRVLKDDRRGILHQRFIIRLNTGHTLLVVHNISAAPRVPVRLGDRLQVRGEYRWNDKGGLLHFTHRAAGKARSRPNVGLGGWIRTSDGSIYR